MESLILTPLSFFILFWAGLMAGFIDSIAGGGGLISVPVLLFMGFPPQMALGTNKLQSSFGSFSAMFNYIRNGQASIKDALPGIFFTFAGAVGGSWMVQQLDPAFIEPLIPALLLVVFIHTLFSGKVGLADQDAKISRNFFWFAAGTGLGFYDGFFGPGTGSFWTAGVMFFMGYNMLRAAGYTKIMNFTSNIVALTLFIMGGNVCYQAGLIMAVGQVAGALIGSGLAIKKGVAFIRPLFLTVVFLTIVRLVYLSYLG